MWDGEGAGAGAGEGWVSGQGEDRISWGAPSALNVPVVRGEV